MHGAFVDHIGKINDRVELSRTERDHLFKTLRANAGEEVKLLDGNGTVAIATVLKDKSLEIIKSQKHEPEQLRIHLATAAPRRQKLDVLLKQLAEVGVWSINLIHCQRSVAKPEGKERWQTLLQEGCKQSGNPFLPTITPLQSLENTLKEWQKNQITPYYGAVISGNEPVKVPSTGDIGFLVGPEGGFTDLELEMMVDYGAKGVNLGPWILRLETAALCGVCGLRIMAK